jgi:tetratricopeptide (TPR) repeat protein
MAGRGAAALVHGLHFPHARSARSAIPVPEGAVQPGSVLTACLAASALLGARPAASGPLLAPEPSTEANVVSPPFSAWDPDARRVFHRENRHAAYAAEIHYDLGLWFFERSEYELSLQHYRRAREIDPSFAEPCFGIGLLFYTLGDDDNALRYYELALERSPEDPDVFNNLGLIHYRRGELDRAEARLREALRLQPDFPDALYNLGLVYYQEKKLDAAVAQFERAISQDPAYHRARFNLGVVYFELGKNELAEQQWSRIQEAVPGTPLAEQAGQNLAILRGGRSTP